MAVAHCDMLPGTTIQTSHLVRAVEEKMLTPILLLILSFLIPFQLLGQSRENSRQQLEESIAAFYNAIARGDALSRVALLDSNVILMPNGFTMIRGRDKVAEVFTSDTATVIFQLKDRTLIDILQNDSIAFTVNSYNYTWHKKGDQPQWRKTKNVHIWRRDKEGRWKLRLDIWNSDVPIEFRKR